MFRNPFRDPNAEKLAQKALDVAYAVADHLILDWVKDLTIQLDANGEAEANLQGLCRLRFGRPLNTWPADGRYRMPGIFMFVEDLLGSSILFNGLWITDGQKAEQLSGLIRFEASTLDWQRPISFSIEEPVLRAVAEPV